MQLPVVADPVALEWVPPGCLTKLRLVEGECLPSSTALVVSAVSGLPVSYRGLGGSAFQTIGAQQRRGLAGRLPADTPVLNYSLLRERRSSFLQLLGTDIICMHDQSMSQVA